MANEKTLALTVAKASVGVGTLAGTVVVGWLIARGDGSQTAWLLLGTSGVLIVAGVAYLLARQQLEKFASEEAKGLIAVTAVGLMLAVGARADPGTGKLADRILVWAFVVFAVGLCELFVLFVVTSILGKIDLSRAFVEKPVLEGAANGNTSDSKTGSVVSLSRLQAFAWTLVVMIIYFHRVVTNKSGELPAIPPELLMVMGISGAVYLTSKEMGARAELEKAKMPGGGKKRGSGGGGGGGGGGGADQEEGAGKVSHVQQTGDADAVQKKEQG